MARSGGVGRHDVVRVPDSRHGLPSDVPVSVNNRSDLTIIAITDPHDERRRVRAIARIDLLDALRRTGRISEASYLIGRELEEVFERRIGGGGQWWNGDRIDGATSARLALELGYDRGVLTNAMLAWMVRHLGPFDTRLLVMVLADRKPFSVAAMALGRPGVRGRRYVADRFVDALGVLAEAKAARGR